MKIGILTLPITENYGGILQAVALYRFLHSKGHEVHLIYKKNYYKKSLLKNALKSVLLTLPLLNINNVKGKHKVSQEALRKTHFHKAFIDSVLFNISSPMFSTSELENYVNEEGFDAVIVGSDQVWRLEYINDIYYKSYFLDFVDVKKTKKIAYAASFGKNHWEGVNDHQEISRLLQDFTAVSVREANGVEVCKNQFNYEKSQQVLDPTLLVGKQFYIDEVISKNDTSKVLDHGLLTYVLDEAIEKKQIIEFAEKESELENIFHLKGFNGSREIISIPEWVASFANADFVVTDSFHGMVFSLIFEKDFIVIGNKDRGLERFKSLLTMLQLENRLVFSKDDLSSKRLDKIDYSKVRQLLDAKKNESEEFLNNALAGG